MTGRASPTTGPDRSERVLPVLASGPRGRARRGPPVAVAVALLAGAASLASATNSAAQRAPAPSASTARAPVEAGAFDAAPDVELELPEEPAPSSPPAPASVTEPTPAPSASPSAAAPPSAAPPPSAPTTAPSAAAQPSAAAADVLLQGDAVFTLRVGHAGKSAKQRAEAASIALADAAKTAQPGDVRVEEREGVAVVYAGSTPVVQLVEADARSAGDATLHDHAAATAARVREAIRRERKRSAIAGTVFSISLVVLGGLIALYLLRRIADLTERARNWLLDNPQRVPAIRIYSMDVVRPPALRSALVVSLGAGRFVGQLAVVYVWLIGTLSLFDSTRGYTERLTGFVITPLSGLMSRVVSSLPLLVVAAIAALAVWLLLRFVGLFFTSVARGETKFQGLPEELAEPTSLVVRAGIVMATLVFAAPIVTGDPEGALARTGTVLLGALGLASTPLLASAVAGAAVVYSRKLRSGTWAEIDGHVGRVSSVGLLEVRLKELDGSELRIPHLLCLVRAARVLGSAPRIGIELCISPAESPSKVAELLLESARGVGDHPRVDISRADAAGIDYQLSVLADNLAARARLYDRALNALAESNVPLGRRSAPGQP